MIILRWGSSAEKTGKNLFEVKDHVQLNLLASHSHEAIEDGNNDHVIYSYLRLINSENTPFSGSRGRRLQTFGFDYS